MVEGKINIGGNTIKLKFTNRAVRQIDRELGYSAIHIIEKAQKHGGMAPLSLDCVATIIWGGMLHLGDAKTVDDVADMIPLKMSELVPIADKAVNFICKIYEIDDAEIEVHQDDAKEAGAVGKDQPAGAGEALNEQPTDTSE